MIEIGAGPLTLEDVASVVKGGEAVRLGDEARRRMDASRRVVTDAVDQGRVLYGITTGFGALKDRTISADQLRDLQLNLVRSHQAGLGPEAPREVSRTMLLLRATRPSANKCSMLLTKNLIISPGVSSVLRSSMQSPAN